MASREVWNEIRKAKANIEKKLSCSTLAAVWHGIKTMASINQYANDEKTSISLNGIDDLDLPDACNSFFSCQGLLA